jgi:hypothetical protein
MRGQDAAATADDNRLALPDRLHQALGRYPVHLAVLFAFGLKVYLAASTYGTNDVLYRETILRTLRDVGGIEAYHSIWYLNHPPFLLHFLSAADWISSVSGLSFPFVIRFLAIAADVGSVWLVWQIVRGDHSIGRLRWKLVLLAIAPASIMISGFHGNYDPVMIFFVLLSVYLVHKRESAGLAGLAMGLALSIKVSAVLFLPMFVLYLPDIRKRMRYLFAAGVMAFIACLPYIAQDPVFILKRVLGYSSLYGIWGLSRILNGGLPSGLEALNRAYMDAGGYLVLALLIVMAFIMNRRPNRPSLFVQCGISAFAFMSLTPGFGVQYFAWLVPWVVIVGVGTSLIFYATTGLFLFLVYTYWSRGFPWYFANSDVVGVWRGHIVLFEGLAWLAVVGIWFVLIKSTRGPGNAVPAARTTHLPPA